MFLIFDLRAVDGEVCISIVVAAIEGMAVVFSQRPAVLENLNEIWVGGEDATESNKVPEFVSDLGSSLRMSAVSTSRNEIAFPCLSKRVQSILLPSIFIIIIITVAGFEK